MTEEDAKQRWCPFSRVSLYHRSTAANRMVRYGSGAETEDFKAFEGGTRCLGSGCMAWRWTWTTYGDSTTDGHCGLASTP